MKKKFNVYKMTCSACSSKVEKHISGLDGVNQCSVNLLTSSMEVDIDDNILDEDIIKEVYNIGYEAKVYTKGVINKSKLGKKIVISLIFFIPLMYIAMGHMIGLPIFILDEIKNTVYFILIQFILALPIMFIFREYFIRGIKNLIKKAPNMDSLIAVGSLAAFIYGTYALVLSIINTINYNEEILMYYKHNLYFESSVMILILVSVGKFLEAKAKNKTTEAIDLILNLAPDKVFVEKEGKETLINVSDVKKGDIIVLKPGDRIAIDGILLEGNTSIDESTITGEAIPVYKNVGDDIISGCINLSSNIKYQATKVGNDTNIAKLSALVEEAASSKAPISKIADKVSGIFVPIVMMISMTMFILWMIITKGDFDFSLNIAISVLVISCPCALGLATPVAVMVGIGKAAENNILIKSATSLEEAHKIDCLLLDKTGTITQGKPRVIEYDEYNEKALDIAYSMEKGSNHPLALAICNYALEKKANYIKCNIKEASGKGLTSTIDDVNYYLGSKEYIYSITKLETLSDDYIYLADDKKILARFKIIDDVKDSSVEAIRLIKNKGIKVIMLTGDNKANALAINEKVKANEVISNVLPEDKLSYVKKYQEQGYIVGMVGDGINDSAALMASNVGIAIGAGADIAIESSDAILASNDLMDVYNLIALSKDTIKTIKMNLFWAFFYNVITIPVACGILYPVGITLTPMIGSACMSLSSVTVVLNALRLKKFRIERIKEDMNIEIKVESMMCQNCVRHVKEAVLQVEGVKGVEIDLKKKKVVVEAELELKEAVYNAIRGVGHEPAEYVKKGLFRK